MTDYDKALLAALIAARVKYRHSDPLGIYVDFAMCDRCDTRWLHCACLPSYIKYREPEDAFWKRVTERYPVEVASMWLRLRCEASDG